MRIKKQKQSFTLVEMVIVMVIVAILVSLSAPRFFNVVEKGRQAEAVEVLTRMYKGYKRAIIDEELCSGTLGYEYCDESFSSFHPQEVDDAAGVSARSWATLGFDKNPNLERSDLYFSYDFLKPSSGYGLESETQRAYGMNRPSHTDFSTFDEMAVAWRKTSNTPEGDGRYPIDFNRWIAINLNTGKIGKSQPY